MNASGAVQQLQEFNQAAVELFNLSFVKKMQKPGGGFTIHYDHLAGMSAEFRGPDEEAIKAYCNDIRKFIQKNDTLCITKLQPIYQSDIVVQTEKEEYGKTVSEYNTYLEQKINHRINGKIPTRKEVLDVFLYGKYSHRTKGTKELHDNWNNWEVTSVLLKNEFVSILYKHLIFINKFAIVNNDILERFGHSRIISKSDSHE